MYMARSHVHFPPVIIMGGLEISVYLGPQQVGGR